MNRNDLIRIERAPKCVENLLVDLAGRNPFGEPNYRVVLAHLRVHQQAAEWNDWDKDTPVEERGAIGAGRHPIRAVKEMRSIPRYPLCECREGVLQTEKDRAGRVVRSWYAKAGDCEKCNGVRGWIVEKWWPAHVITSGRTEAQWHAMKLEGTDLPKLGPFPETGAYRRVEKSVATAEIPSLTQLAQLVMYLESRKQSAPSEEQMLRDFDNAREYERRRLDAARDEADKELIRQSLEPLQGSSLRAGREREKYADRLRARGIPVGHVGT